MKLLITLLLSLFLFSFPLISFAGGFIFGFPMPSLDDEKRYYTSEGQTFTNGDLCFTTCNMGGNALWANAQPTYTAGVFSIHGDTEGDDLWLYLLQWFRTGQIGFKDRADKWAIWMRDTYFNLGESSDEGTNGFLWDHVYTDGLISYYEATGDTSYLNAAKTICNMLNAEWLPASMGGTGNNRFREPGVTGMGLALRGWGRHLYSISRCYEYDTAAYEFTFLRIVDMWLQAPDFATGGPSGGGNYYYPDYVTDDPGVCGAGAFASGIRVEEPNHTAMLTNGLFHAFRLIQDPSRKAALKTRLIQMAKWAKDFGLDDVSNYTMPHFGANIKTGVKVHCAKGSGYPTIALVNLMVFGSWLETNSAEKTALYNRAKTQLLRGTRTVFDIPTNQVEHFLDVITDSSTAHQMMWYNKGELQYAWAIFHPINRNTQLGNVALGLPVGDISTNIIANGQTILNSFGGITHGSGQKFTFASTAEYDRGNHFINFCGSDHIAQNPPGKQCVKIDESFSASWLDEAMDHSGDGTNHGYDGIAIDPIRRRLIEQTYAPEVNRMDIWTCDISLIDSCKDTWVKRVDLSFWSQAQSAIEVIPWRDSIFQLGIQTCTGTKCGTINEINLSTFSLSTLTAPSGDPNTGVECCGAIESSVGYPHLAYITNSFNNLGSTGREFYTINKAGILTRRADLPSGCSGYEQNTLPVVDPVTGDFIIIGCDNLKVYKYNGITVNTWSEIVFPSTPPWFVGQSDGYTFANRSVVTPISTYGVIAVAKCNGHPQDCHLYLWKYADMLSITGGGGGTPPVKTYILNLAPGSNKFNFGNTQLNLQGAP